MKKLLLQICCAPCGTYISRDRLAPRYELTWYFCNPNLVSPEEYEKRLAAVKAMAEKFAWPLIVEPYDHAAWSKFASCRASDPERGERCRQCYRLRLAQTARLAKERGFDLFGTTLLASPYKDTAAIMAIGRELAGVYGLDFLAEDFQADDGYRRSQELARNLGLYRQKFCGCEYSLAPVISPLASARKVVTAGIIIFLFLLFGIFSNCVLASDSLDSDGDGYSDTEEIENDYSPYNPAKVKITLSDMDKDGLSDYWELKFKTDPLQADTDGDGFLDGAEVDAAYDPISTSTKKITQGIEINLHDQQLTYLVGGQPWKKFTVSTGKASMPTPTGTFKILNKVEKAWSKSYGLWMPYWLGLNRGEFGIHELPVWPGGYREGANHLGKPVSHGCIRLGIGAAQYIYERVATGTTVVIKSGK